MPTLLTCDRCGAAVQKREVVAGRAVGIDAQTCVCAGCRPRWQALQARRQGQPPAAENENFVALLQAAADDADLRRRLIAIARLDAFNRESLLNTLSRDLQLQGAPAELVTALLFLKDDDIARQVLKVLP